MTYDADILIVGGGLNGPSLALALAQGGLRVTVVDALPRDTREGAEFDGRAYALALASTRVLDGIGIWANVVQDAQPILQIKASDGRAGEGAAPFFLHFDHAEIEEGPMGHMLEDRYLRRALLEAMDTDPNITQIEGRRVVAQNIGANGITATTDDGQVLRARILVGCDGRDSAVAQRAGIKRTGWDYGQTALVCAIAHDDPHQGCAHQFFMPAGPLAILPLPGNRSSIVWSESSATAADIHAMDDAHYLDALRPRFGDFLGAIALEGKRFAYPLRLTLANSFIGPRLALVGDAAHGMHPIAGQGFNFGLRDIAALAEVLILAARRGEDISSPIVLERYQQWRRFDTMMMALGTDSVNRLFSNDSALLRGVRGLGMGVVQSLPGLRRRFIREAAGLSGDLPRLMRGLPI
ncbi:FAD-dependent monooxygenase [Roseinatronobacter alkalisoli]|uniref:FAD-dependent monooxygenase n=1 Tax=Roseinatronobacter alkalisoli TaxID=3028235 RepID=A0ABT5TCI3_9RHOB|nr:FAD-dependent monooxygenase [Roseinatronobacter sp. HJB301]MDD7971882.1 FAD-dependent monooxygenase [Roseinatronobacter sp. HJB301]